jgi:hypothetical protein
MHICLTNLCAHRRQLNTSQYRALVFQHEAREQAPLAAAGPVAFMYVKPQIGASVASFAAESTITMMDSFDEVGAGSLGRLVPIPILSANAEHQVVFRLFLLGSLQEFGTSPTQSQLRTTALCNLFHVLATTSNHSPHHSKLWVFLNANNDLALVFLTAGALANSFASSLATPFAFACTLARVCSLTFYGTFCSSFAAFCSSFASTFCGNGCPLATVFLTSLSGFLRCCCLGYCYSTSSCRFDAFI